MRTVPRVVVHLVRHGEVENPGRVRYGRLPGFGLSPRGREQAERAAQFLARTTPRVSWVVSSPLERAKETADAIVRRTGAREIIVDDRVIEAASRFDGLPRVFAPHLYLRRHAETVGRDVHETPFVVATRMRDALTDLASRAERDGHEAIAIVTHQLPIQYVRHLFAASDSSAWLARLRWQLGWVPKARCDHASITTVTFEDARVVAVEYVEPGPAG